MRKKNSCQAAWNTSVSDIFKPNIQITSIKWTLHARPLEHKGQAAQKNKHIWVKMNCSTYKPFILLSFFTCYLHQRGCSSAAVSATLGQEEGASRPLLYRFRDGWCIFGAMTTSPCCPRSVRQSSAANVTQLGALTVFSVWWLLLYMVKLAVPLRKAVWINSRVSMKADVTVLMWSVARPRMCLTLIHWFLSSLLHPFCTWGRC